MNRSDFKNLYAYSDACWELMGETLENTPGAWRAEFETVSKWNSIRLILAHCIAAEERIVTRMLQGGTVPVGYEDRAAQDWPDLYQDHRAIRRNTYARLNSLTDAEIEGSEIVGQLGEGRPAFTRSDALFHIVNHENFHRGQVITTLQRLGFDPPNFDYLLLKKTV